MVFTTLETLTSSPLQTSPPVLILSRIPIFNFQKSISTSTSSSFTAMKSKSSLQTLHVPGSLKKPMTIFRGRKSRSWIFQVGTYMVFGTRKLYNPAVASCHLLDLCLIVVGWFSKIPFNFDFLNSSSAWVSGIIVSYKVVSANMPSLLLRASTSSTTAQLE